MADRVAGIGHPADVSGVTKRLPIGILCAAVFIAFLMFVGKWGTVNDAFGHAVAGGVASHSSSNTAESSNAVTPTSTESAATVPSQPAHAPTTDAAGNPQPGLAAAGLLNGGTSTVNAGKVQELLDTLTVSAGNSSGYDRMLFGPAWQDTDGSGCDTRDQVLRATLSQVTYKTGACTVATGVLADPYTGTTIDFTRGVKTSTLVQIDHLVPEGYAFAHGASNWSGTQRLHFANDLEELTAVQGSANEKKSDYGPGRWMPTNASYACTYVTRFTYIEAKYQLSINSADKKAVSRELTKCS